MHRRRPRWDAYRNYDLQHREPVVVTTTLHIRILFPTALEVEELAAPTSAAAELDVNFVEIEPNIGDTENTPLLTKTGTH